MVAFAGMANATTITADFDTGVAPSLSHGNDRSAVNAERPGFRNTALPFTALPFSGSDDVGTHPLPTFGDDVAIFDTDLAESACGADCDLNVNDGNALAVQNPSFQGNTDDAFAVVKNGDNGNQQISSLADIGLAINTGDEVYFEMAGSGAIDDLAFDLTAVPAPPMLPLLATTLAGLGLFGRRRKWDRAA